MQFDVYSSTYLLLNNQLNIRIMEEKYCSNCNNISCRKRKKSNLKQFITNICTCFCCNKRKNPEKKLKKTRRNPKDGTVLDNSNQSFLHNKKHEKNIFLVRKAVEESKLLQASKMLLFIKNKELVMERLILERILLESGEKLEMIKDKLEGDYDEPLENMFDTGSIVISNIKLSLNDRSNEHHYFILLVICGTEIQSSKIIKAMDMSLNFDEAFNLQFSSNKMVKIRIYSINPETMFKSFKSTLQRKTRTSERARMSNGIFDSSFKKCGLFTIGPQNFMKKTFKIFIYPDSNLKDFADASVKVESNRPLIKRTAFLTLGMRNEDLFIWNFRYCVLNGAELKFYTSPINEELNEAELTLNLGRCSSPVEVLDSCPRKKCLSIRIDKIQYFLKFNQYSELNEWKIDLNIVSNWV